jgi:spermidine synthase
LALFLPTSQRLVPAERNFYGVNRVRDLAASDLRRMEHGDTIHGLLALDRDHRLTRLGYYNPMGGLAQTTLAINAGRAEPKIALVGLGAGEMVCTGGKGWRYDIYEIDPGVIRIASDAALFPFLHECAPSHRIIQGDGRLRLRNAPDAEYDQIILDAFTSDAIPAHLLTREALAEYLTKLKPDGVLTLHLSNRYFKLAPVVAAEARDLGLSSLGHVSPAAP